MLSEAVDSSLKFTTSGDSTWSAVSGSTWDYYCDADSARSYDSVPSGKESVLQTIVDSASSETLKFYWKVSCEQYSDYLEFYIDGQLQSGRITGETDWAQKTYSISSGIHTLKWVYNSSGGDDGDNCGWVDFVQWTGASPVPDSNNWQTIDYKYDVYGRRSEKKVDGYATRYFYDGDHVIAEYDGNNNLMRKYIYGPGVDQPVSMIEVADSNATYYYHYDALGSVIALSDSGGDTVQTYEYSVFGEVAAYDPNHTNPYMFAGRRFDIEIGLYYNRARYYNPYTGRFLQTDPIGYADGINWYAYCGNNPLALTDPLGLAGTFDPTVHGEGTDGVWGYFMDIDGNVKGLTGVWNAAGLGRDWGLMPWELATHTVDGIVYFTQTNGAPPDDYVPGNHPIWDLENPPIFGQYEDIDTWIPFSIAATAFAWSDALGVCGDFGRMDTFDMDVLWDVINPYPQLGPEGGSSNEEYWRKVHKGVGWALGAMGMDYDTAYTFMRTWEMTEPGIWTVWGLRREYQGRDKFEGGDTGIRRDMIDGGIGWVAGVAARTRFFLERQKNDQE